jgi:hypothetical protein
MRLCASHSNYYYLYEENDLMKNSKAFILFTFAIAHCNAYFTCDTNLCECQCYRQGYESDCITESRAKFIGTYAGRDSGSAGYSGTYNITISSSSTSVTDMIVTNLASRGVSMKAVVFSPSTIFLSYQTLLAGNVDTTAGLGYITADSSLYLSYSIDTAGRKDAYVFHGVKY